MNVLWTFNYFFCNCSDKKRMFVMLLFVLLLECKIVDQKYFCNPLKLQKDAYISYIYSYICYNYENNLLHHDFPLFYYEL